MMTRNSSVLYRASMMLSGGAPEGWDPRLQKRQMPQIGKSLSDLCEKHQRVLGLSKNASSCQPGIMLFQLYATGSEHNGVTDTPKLLVWLCLFHSSTVSRNRAAFQIACRRHRMRQTLAG